MIDWFPGVVAIGAVIALGAFFGVLGMFAIMMLGVGWAITVGVTQLVMAALTVVVILTLVYGGWEMLVTAGGMLALFGFLSAFVLFLTLWERKVLARIQQRIGPQRAGPWGVLQPLADAVKIVAKEDVLPLWVDKGVYWLAPIAFFIPTFLVWLVIPFDKGWTLRNMDLGMLYITAFAVVAIAGLFMAGWGSANKYGFLGSLRAIAQLISYEIPIIVVTLTVAMAAGSLNLTEVVEAQGRVPYVALMPMGFFLFLLAGLAELGRTPFDIYHAESEVMGGPFLEFSGAHWAIFYLAEYVNTFLVAVLVTLFFLSGWIGPVLPGVVWLFIKVIAVVTVIFWFRATYPRFRIDQLMALGWKVLIPLAFLNFILVAISLFYGWPAWTLTVMGFAQLAGFAYWTHRRLNSPSRRPALRMVPARELRSNA
jgi:NADH-quinone oxidoreductase subunit H